MEYVNEKKIIETEAKPEVNNCSQLEEIECHINRLTSLDVSKNNKLAELTCSNNRLTQLSLPTNPTNLKTLILTNTHFTGSLEYLSEMRELRKLNISDTDIDSGLEYLPDSLEEFYYSMFPVGERPNAKCQVFDNILKNVEGTNFSDKLKIYKQKKLKKEIQLVEARYRRIIADKEQRIIELETKLQNIRKIVQEEQVAQIAMPPKGNN
ncbi:11953_t:CDS:2 [Ambispora gerdemannii]|uniref:11953_t:CDS:1 n=1 Tax=Ambispora gerdemannii TaxID=144530 RepID=A0A9N9ECM3_9GLOM|nr:11953_t:CDS:2 [Ambispora gerdemannii]